MKYCFHQCFVLPVVGWKARNPLKNQNFAVYLTSPTLQDIEVVRVGLWSYNTGDPLTQLSSSVKPVLKQTSIQ